MERSKLIQELFKGSTNAAILEAVARIRRESLEDNDDPIVVLGDFTGGWSNLETVKVTSSTISISPETDRPFSSDN